MEIPQLMGIANELGVQVSQDSALEDVIYAIIDKAAENSAAGEDAPKRKRTRIAKKDTSKVYTVKGSDGENLDSKSNRTTKKAVKGSDGENLDSKSNRTTKKAEQASLFSDMPVAAPEEPSEPAPEAPAPKRRGRKPKALVEAEAAAAAAAAEVEAEASASEVVPEAQEIMEVPEAQDFAPADSEDAGVDADAMAKLREKMSSHNEPELRDEWATQVMALILLPLLTSPLRIRRHCLHSICSTVLLFSRRWRPILPVIWMLLVMTLRILLLPMAFWSV